MRGLWYEAYKLLAGSFDDVIDSVGSVIEDSSTNNEDIGRLKKEQKALENLEQRRKKRMASLKKALSGGNILEEFDRVVFESIVEKVIVGETNDDGTVDPFKLTFVMKGNGNSVVPNAKDWFKGKTMTDATDSVD